MTRPPPPRYKIVERDGRLITIDTWAKNGLPPQPSAQPRRGNTVVPGGGVGESLVAAVLKVRDDEGRRLLTTSPNWDRKGPRVIALSAAGEQRIGSVMLASSIVLLAAIVAAILDLDLLLPIVVVTVVIAGAMSSARTGVLTRFLDSLGESLTR